MLGTEGHAGNMQWATRIYNIQNAMTCRWADVDAGLKSHYLCDIRKKYNET